MVYQVLIMPVLLYGAECWTMRKKMSGGYTDHGNELPEENAGCHKARRDKK